MNRTARLERYREVLERGGNEVSTFEAFVFAVASLSPAQIASDFDALGVEASGALDASTLRERIDRALLTGRPAAPSFSPFSYTGPNGESTFISAAISAECLEELHSGIGHPLPEWPSTDRAVHLGLVDSAEPLLCLHALETGRSPYPHQVRTVRRFLHQLGGSGIVADEVGLGKTLEAGMIIQEYMQRGLVTNWLLLVPASLVEHWQHELAKFFPPEALTVKVPRTRTEALTENGLLLSIDRAKGKLREVLLGRKWDLVIVDECHILKNSQTQNYKFVYSLSKKYCLLISATPVQNEVRDLYNLVNLCKPGILKGWEDFKRNYLIDRRRPVETDRLRRLLASTITRTRREETGLTDWQDRTVVDLPVALAPEEEAYHERVIDLVRFLYEKHARGVVMLGHDPEQGVPELELLLILVLKELASSREAVVKTLAGALRKRIADLCERLGDSTELDRLDGVVAAVRACRTQSKLRAFLGRLDEMRDRGKVIVFTEFRGTQTLLEHTLRRRGEQPVVFHGDLNRKGKERAQETFERDPECRFMVSTECGGQGLNFQHANVVVNYDFPWNPMRLEQRIGRVDRIGQLRPIWIYNLYARETIEAYIMTVLLEKLVMTRKIVGEIASILSYVGEDFDVEASINKIVLESESFEEMKRRFRELEELLQAGTRHYAEGQKATEKLLELPANVGSARPVEPEAVKLFLTAFAAARGGRAHGRDRTLQVELDASAADRMGLAPSSKIHLTSEAPLQEWKDYGLIWRLLEHETRGLPKVFRAQDRRRKIPERPEPSFARAIRGFSTTGPEIEHTEVEVLRLAVKAVFRGEAMRETLVVGLAIPTLGMTRIETSPEPLTAHLLRPTPPSELTSGEVVDALDEIMDAMHEDLEGAFRAFRATLAGELAQARRRTEQYYETLLEQGAATQGLEPEETATPRQRLERERDRILADLAERYRARLGLVPTTLGLVRTFAEVAQADGWTVARVELSERLFSTGCALCGRSRDSFTVQDGDLYCDDCRADGA